MSRLDDRVAVARVPAPVLPPAPSGSISPANARTFTNRFEIKYLVEARRLPEIHAALRDFLCLDVNGVHGGGYYVHSIYFDSPDFRFYREKSEGDLIRVKPRIRTYRTSLDGPPTGMFLELKGRYNRIVEKRRTRIDPALARELLCETPFDPKGRTAGSSVLGEFQYLSHRFRLAPCVSVLYHRTAYFGAFYPDLRMTFDRMILCSPATSLTVPSEDFAQALPCSKLVIELKYNDKVPRLLLRRLNSLGLQRHTFSKYATALERSFRGLNGHGLSH